MTIFSENFQLAPNFDRQLKMMDDKKSAAEKMPPPSMPDDNDDEEMSPEDKVAIERAGNIF